MIKKNNSLVARFNSIFRVESKNAESKHFPFDWGNSLIGNFALIKDMNPKLQVQSKNPGASPKIQGDGLSGLVLKLEGDLKYDRQC